MKMMKMMSKEQKMITDRIIIRCFNKNLRGYYVSTEISQSTRQTFDRPLRPTSEKYLREVGKIGSTLVREIFGLAGVKQITIAPYDLEVRRGEAFDWKDIQPKVLEALKKVFGDEAEQVEIDYPEKTPKSEKVSRMGVSQRIWQGFKGFVVNLGEES